MSFNTWKKEFYSPITKVAKKSAAAHSLRKWIGLRERNLALHGLELKAKKLVNWHRPDNALLEINSDSCALCVWSEEGWKINCNKCEYKIHFGWDCDAPGQPYSIWLKNADPEPMIKALRELVDAQEVSK